MTTSMLPRRIGKYELQAEIGRGGMGVVYRGYDTLLKRPVAIKVLAPELSAEPHFVQRFRQEAVAAANLDHRNIVTIYDVGQEGETHFIVMELLAGAPLNRWVQGRGLLAAAQAGGIIKQVASALDYAHRRHMVHCDVKPANIMVDQAGHATLMDFGLVHARQSSAQSGEISAGTPEYMAPEQVLGQAVDERTDVYACGAVLFYLLTGQAPFERGAAAAAAYAQVHEPPPPLRKLRPDLPKAVEAVVFKALAKPPAERYPSPGALAADFAAACGGKAPAGQKKAPTPGSAPVKTPQPPPGPARASQVLPAPEGAKASQVLPGSPAAGGTPPPAAPSQPRRSPVLVVAALLVALIAVVAGLAWVFSRDQQVPLAEATPAAAEATPALVATEIPIISPTQVIIAPPGSKPPAAPTATLAPSPSPTATLPPTTPSPPPVATPETPENEARPAAPRLLGPADSVTVSGEAIFQWEWEGALATGQAFEVRLWKEGSAEHLGASAPLAGSAGGRMQQRIDLRLTPAIRQGGNGVYWWTVAVVSTDPYARIGPEAPPRKIYYTGGP